VAEDNFLRRALAFRAAVARALEAVRPEVVHVRGPFEADAAADYAERRGVPLVFEVNGLPSVELAYHHPSVAQAHDFQAKLRGLEQSALDRASLVLTQSETTLGYLRGRGLRADQLVKVIANGADPDRYAAAPRRSAVPQLLYAGTLAGWQGTAELLMALRRTLRTHAVKLVLAGPVRRRWQRSLDRYLRRLRLGDAVELTGPVARDRLAGLVAESDVCIAPLRKDVRNKVQGCSPIKLFEYMAAGRAIVSTDLACVREILDDGRTGLLVSSPRPALLSEALVRLVEDASLREELGSAARAEVIARATWQHRRDALVRAYAELLDTSGPRPRACA
jgi:glycosyltransferase involved in cell wall biosynthesis